MEGDKVIIPFYAQPGVVTLSDAESRPLPRERMQILRERHMANDRDRQENTRKTMQAVDKLRVITVKDEQGNDKKIVADLENPEHCQQLSVQTGLRVIQLADARDKSLDPAKFVFRDFQPWRLEGRLIEVLRRFPPDPVDIQARYVQKGPEAAAESMQFMPPFLVPTPFIATMLGFIDMPAHIPSNKLYAILSLYMDYLAEGRGRAIGTDVANYLSTGIALPNPPTPSDLYLKVKETTIAMRVMNHDPGNKQHEIRYCNLIAEFGRLILSAFRSNVSIEWTGCVTTEVPMWFKQCMREWPEFVVPDRMPDMIAPDFLEGATTYLDSLRFARLKKEILTESESRLAFNDRSVVVDSASRILTLMEETCWRYLRRGVHPSLFDGQNLVALQTYDPLNFLRRARDVEEQYSTNRFYPDVTPEWVHPLAERELRVFVDALARMLNRYDDVDTSNEADKFCRFLQVQFESDVIVEQNAIIAGAIYDNGAEFGAVRRMQNAPQDVELVIDTQMTSDFTEERTTIFRPIAMPGLTHCPYCKIAFEIALDDRSGCDVYFNGVARQDGMVSCVDCRTK